MNIDNVRINVSVEGCHIVIGLRPTGDVCFFGKDSVTIQTVCGISRAIQYSITIKLS